MKRTTIVLLLAFIRELLAVLTYQTNIFPAEHLSGLVGHGKKLIDALLEEE